MKREIRAVPDFVPGTPIYAFERGEVTYLANKGWDDKFRSEVYELQLWDGTTACTPAYNCFELKSYSRTWTLGHSAINVVCGTAYGFKTFVENVGKTSEVAYDPAHVETETILTGELLPIAWRGYGIEFGWLIDRWLRRLEGEAIADDDETCLI